MFAAGCLYRTTACLLQVLVALNRTYFLHEKRAVAIARGFAVAPPRFAATVTNILAVARATPEALVAQVGRAAALVGGGARAGAARRALSRRVMPAPLTSARRA